MWDDLRREARKLESELDSKLSSYSRLGSSHSLSLSSLGSTEPDLSEADLKAEELETLLNQLKGINGSMGEFVQSGPSDLLMHTFERHTGILQELVQEFNQTRKNVTANIQHALLLRGSGSKKNFSNEGETAGLLRERGLLQSTIAKADDVIAQAHATSASLLQQRGTFHDIFGKVSEASQKLPVVGNLLNMIRRKKSRDNIILSGTVAICTLVLTIYWLNKSS